LTSKFLDELHQVPVVRRDHRELLGITERGGGISRQAAERDQRQQDFRRLRANVIPSVPRSREPRSNHPASDAAFNAACTTTGTGFREPRFD
jgi:hypothetical protein